MPTVEFKIWNNGNRVRDGILVYNHQYGGARWVSPDNLDNNGYAKTYWSDIWNGCTVEVYCHTDGVNSGIPAYVGSVEISHNAFYELYVQRNGSGPRWRNM